MNVVESLMQTVKTSCDNDTIMYCFRDDIIARAYNRPMIYKLWTTPTGKINSYYEECTEKDEQGKPITVVKETNISADSGYTKVEVTEVVPQELDTPGSGLTIVDPKYVHGLDEDCYYTRVIMPRLVLEPCLNIYYKNKRGVWVDYRKCSTVFPTLSIEVSSDIHEKETKVDVNRLPKCIYMDENNIIHYIDEHDGLDNDSALTNIEIDTNNDEIVSFRPYSIEKPAMSFKQRHLMEDLRITLPETVDANNFLLWLNGAFVPTMRDKTYQNVVNVRNAMTMIDSRVINQSLGSSKRYTGSGATVELDSSNDEYRLDVKLRFFGWDGVNVSPWYKPNESTNVPIVHNFEAVYITKTVTFPVEINENAHFIMVNGVVLDPTEYIIDDKNRRKITLKNVEREAYSLLSSIVSDINYDKNHGTSYYANVRPLDLIRDAITDKTYSLINFTSSKEGKTLYMKRSTACATNFPYDKEITFSNINSGDMILINGTYSRFEWIHDNTIRMPMLEYFYNGEEGNIKESEVQRIYFIDK